MKKLVACMALVAWGVAPAMAQMPEQFDGRAQSHQRVEQQRPEIKGLTQKQRKRVDKLLREEQKKIQRLNGNQRQGDRQFSRDGAPGGRPNGERPQGPPPQRNGQGQFRGAPDGDRGQGLGQNDQRRAERDAIRQKTDKRVRKVLDQEQYESYLQWRRR